MKRYLPIMFLIVLLLVSCQSKGNNKELFLQINIPDQTPLKISVDQVPILNSYLEQFEDNKNELNRVSSTFLFTNNQKDYILLNYSCGMKLCNQLLLEHKDGEFRSLQVSESSFLQESKQNNEYIAFLFGRNEGTEVLRNQVVIINLKKFQKISPPENLNIFGSFEYPIPMIEWNDNTLIARIADIDDISYKSLNEWNKKKTFQHLEWKVQ